MASEVSDNALARNLIIWLQLEMRGERSSMDRGENGLDEWKDFIVLHDRVIPKFDDRDTNEDGSAKTISA